MSWDDGKLAWQAKDSNLDLGAGGSILRAGGDKLITLSERGRLSLVQATPKGYELLGQQPLFDAQPDLGLAAAVRREAVLQGRRRVRVPGRERQVTRSACTGLQPCESKSRDRPCYESC